MSKFGELVLIAGDCHIPTRAAAIPELFVKMFIPGKFKHIVLTGNMCTDMEIDFFKGICDNVTIVRGQMDINDSNPELTKTDIGGYHITVTNGSNLLLQSGDVLLTSMAHRMKSDIFVYGSTHVVSVEKKDGILYVNPGSLTGAFTASLPQNNPSFIVLAILPEEITVFIYQLKDGKLDVGKTVFKKNE